MRKSFLVLAFLIFFVINPAEASFNSLSFPTNFSCENPSGTGTLNFFPGAPSGNYSATFTPSGSDSDLVKISSGSFGSAFTIDFNIPSDESSGLSFPIEIDTDSIPSTGTTVNILVSPGDSLTSETGFGSTSTSIIINYDGCELSPPEEETDCSAEFTTNGLQPSGGSFQDDNEFKNHTEIVGGLIKDLGEVIEYAVSANDPKELPQDRFSLALARNPNYSSFDDLTTITFTGTSEYTKTAKVKLKISASDAGGEVMSYKHPMVLTGPFEPPCGEAQAFTLTFDLKKLKKKTPAPPAFKLTAAGGAELKAEVEKVSDKSVIMSTTTDFSVTKTQAGTIGILPVGNPKSPNVLGITRKLKKDAKKFANVLSRNMPDFYPLPSEVVDFIELPFLVYRPTDVSNISNASLLAAQRETNLRTVRRMINLTADDYISSGKADVIISVFDSDTFGQIDDGSAAAFAFVGSVASPGKMFVQTVGVKKKFSKGKINQRAEDAIHEIAHSYGFVGSDDTTCPPDIHNVSSNFSDSCRITRGSKLSSSCKTDTAHIMGPSVPTAMITQCTFENMTDIFKQISTNKSASSSAKALIKSQAELKTLSSADGINSLLLQFTIQANGNSASLEPIYDSEKAAETFLSSASASTWYIDLKSGGSSLERLYFEFSPSSYAPDKELSTLVLEKYIPIDQAFTQIALVNNGGTVLLDESFVDAVPTVTLNSADYVSLKSTKKNGTNVSLEWTILDTSGNDTLSTVLVGETEDDLVVHGDAFEIEGNTATITGIDKKKIKYAQVIVTNGSRSAKSEVLEIE